MAVIAHEEAYVLSVMPSRLCSEGPKLKKEKARDRFYHAELDVLRLLAFLMVWISHASIPLIALVKTRTHEGCSVKCLEMLAGVGSFGVPVFFFLSAFLITELMLREQDLTGTIHLRAFWMRRVLRIWPLYFGVLALYASLGMRLHGFRIEPGRLLASLAMVGNWYLIAHPALTTPMRALWSISVEEQWYVCWPLLLRVLRAKASLLSACFAIFLLAQVSLWGATKWADPEWLHVSAWMNSLVQFQYFALGATVAVWLRGRVPRVTTWRRGACVWSAIACLTVAAAVCGVRQRSDFHSVQSMVGGYLLIGMGTALLFFATYGVCVAPRFAVRLGKISFGLYVFHETGFFLAESFWKHLLWCEPREASYVSLVLQKLTALLLTVAMAEASYRWWEEPFLRLKERWTLIPSRAVAL